nr:hypothetical protein CFP56_74270 [Quercus suber]
MSIELAIGNCLKKSLHQIGNCLKTPNHFTGHKQMIAFLILLNIENMSGSTRGLYTTKNSTNQIDEAFATDGQATQVAWVLKTPTRQSRPLYKRLQ